MYTQAQQTQRNLQAKLLKALRTARIAAHSNVCIWRESYAGVGLGYRDVSVATVREILLHALQLLQTSNIQYGNLHSTDGSEDSNVRFTYANTSMYICTCYGA